MGPWGMVFGLLSAGAFAVSALFATRHHRDVSAFMVIMWAATKVWNYKTGTDGQLYLDTALALLCALLCMHVMAKNRRAAWPLFIAGIMATWITMNAAYAEIRFDCEPWVRWSYQLASNVLYAMAIAVNAADGVRRGALVVRRRLSRYPVRSPRPYHGAGWGREAPGAISKRKAKAR